MRRPGGKTRFSAMREQIENSSAISELRVRSLRPRYEGAANLAELALGRSTRP